MRKIALFCLFVLIMSIQSWADSLNVRGISFYQTPGLPQGIQIVDTFAFIADYDSGMTILNISEKTSPQKISSFIDDSMGYAFDICIKDSLAYIAYWNLGLKVVKIIDPLNPELISTFDSVGPFRDIEIKDDYAYLIDFNDGLRIVDIKNSYELKETSSFKIYGNSFNLAINDTFLYVANEDSGLYIINISNPESPSLLGHYPAGGDKFWDISLSGNYGYVATTNRGILILNLSNPGNPVEAGTYDAKPVYDVITTGKYAYVSIGDMFPEIQVLDITDPVNPQKVGYYTSVCGVNTVVIDDYIYVVGYTDKIPIGSGLCVLQKFEALGIAVTGGDINVKHKIKPLKCYNHTIKYNLYEDNLISLKIYNLLGEQVKIIDNGYKSAGEYTYKIDGLISGLYFIRLRIGKEVFVGKIIYVK